VTQILPDRLIKNPIATFEIQHTPHQLAWLNRVAFLVGIPIALWVISLLVWLAWRHTPEQFTQLDPVLDWLQTPVMLLVVLGILLHIQTIAQTLNMSVSTKIRRTHTGAWESLLMTGIDARRLVYGRWWAVVRLTWRRFLMLGVIRAGAVLGLGMVLMNNGTRSFVYLDAGPSSAPGLDAALAALFVFALTLVNGAFTAAAGVLGALLADDTAPRMVTATASRAGALLLPLFLPLIPISGFLLVSDALNDSASVTVFILQIIGMVQATLVDNGVLLGGMFANPLDQGSGVFVPAGLIALAVYAGLVWGVLWVAQVSARRQGVTTEET